MNKLGALQRAHSVTGAGMHHLHHSGSCITTSRIKYAQRRFECITAILGMPTSTGLPATRHTCGYHLYATAGAACWSVWHAGWSSYRTRDLTWCMSACVWCSDSWLTSDPGHCCTMSSTLLNTPPCTAGCCHLWAAIPPLLPCPRIRPLPLSL